MALLTLQNWLRSVISVAPESYLLVIVSVVCPKRTPPKSLICVIYLPGSLQEVLQIHDVLARVYLARLCYILSRARVLDGGFPQWAT